MKASMLSNLARAATSLVLTPVTVLQDVLRLPASAEANEHPFTATRAMLRNANDCVRAAVQPQWGG